jgi:hypothetical protein
VRWDPSRDECNNINPSTEIGKQGWAGESPVYAGWSTYTCRIRRDSLKRYDCFAVVTVISFCKGGSHLSHEVYSRQPHSYLTTAAGILFWHTYSIHTSNFWRRWKGGPVAEPWKIQAALGVNFTAIQASVAHPWINHMFLAVDIFDVVN